MGVSLNLLTRDLSTSIEDFQEIQVYQLTHANLPTYVTRHRHFIEVCDSHDMKTASRTREWKKDSWGFIPKCMAAIIGLISIAYALVIAFYAKA